MYWGVAERPWLYDDFDNWLTRLKGPPHKCAFIFVDNSGIDIILGIFPFARLLLKLGTQVRMSFNLFLFMPPPPLSVPMIAFCFHVLCIFKVAIVRVILAQEHAVSTVHFIRISLFYMLVFLSKLMMMMTTTTTMMMMKSSICLCPCVHACVHLSVMFFSAIFVVCIDGFLPDSSVVQFDENELIRFYGVKRSKVKVIGRRHTELNAVH